MGEEADYLVERMLDGWWSDYEAPEPQCRRCGQGGLRWVHGRNGWRLYDGKKVHRCKVSFEDES